MGGPDQQALFAAGGVEAHRCLIGHCCGNADPAYHRRIVDGGSYIGFDRIGMLRFQPDEVRADNLVHLVRSGHAAQVMMSQDRHCGWLGKLARQATAQELAHIATLKAQGQWPPPYSYLFTDFIPMLLERGLILGEIIRCWMTTRVGSSPARHCPCQEATRRPASRCRDKWCGPEAGRPVQCRGGWQSIP